MKRTGVWGGLLLFAVTLGAAACASMGTETKAEPSLYRRLGGREAIAGVVDDFVVFALTDPTIGPAFKALPPAKVAPLKTNIADFICENSGGPCSYGGRTMKESHKGLGLDRKAFDACNGALVKALDKRKVGQREKDELMKVVQSLMNDIIGQ